MNLVRQLKLLGLVVCTSLVLAGCQPSTKTANSEPTLESIAVAPSAPTLTISGSQALTVTGTFSDSSTLDLTSGATFNSDNSAVATVSAAGVVTAVNSAGPSTAGVAHIAVAAGGKTATATVTVSPPALVSIAVAPKGVPLFVGGSQALSVRGTYSQGSSAALTTGLTYASDHTNVATVDASGVVTAVAVGTATITVTSTAGGQTDTAVVTVTTQPVATLVSVAATPTSIALAPGGTQQLTVKGTYSNNATPLLAPANESFQSSDSTVATVSAAGLVTAVGNGTATITVTDTASGLVASPSPVVTVSTASGNGRVYTNGALDTGVGFVPFGGSTNVPLPAADSSTLFTDGTAALKVVVTGAAGAYSGGAWVASSTRDLRGFNALTFWAKGSKAQSTLKVQLGNDAGSGANVDYQVETIGVPLTTSWQQYAIPLPDPAKANGIDGLISFADANNNYTFWLANVQYANLPAGQLGTGFVAGDGFNAVPLGGSPPSLAVPVGGTYGIGEGPNSIVWTLGATPFVALGNGGNLDNDAWSWFTLTSSDPTVATVSSSGIITGVKAGTTTITAKLAGTAIPGQVPVTVTAPLATPTTSAPTPSLPAASVIAMFDSNAGLYPQATIDNLNENWCGAGATEAPYAIPGGGTVLKYVLPNCTGIGFEGHPVNVTAAGMTSFHMDVWSPNPVSIIYQLVDGAGGGVGSYTPPVIAANTWTSIDVPLSSFVGLSSTTALQQIGLINGGVYTVLYIDNIYFHK